MSTITNPALAALRRAVTGRIESGDAVAIVEVPAPHMEGVESEEDYARACDALYAADPSNRCQHDNGTENIEGVEVCDMCGETVGADA